MLPQMLQKMCFCRKKHEINCVIQFLACTFAIINCYKMPNWCVAIFFCSFMTLILSCFGVNERNYKSFVIKKSSTHFYIFSKSISLFQNYVNKLWNSFNICFHLSCIFILFCCKSPSRSCQRPISIGKVGIYNQSQSSLVDWLF